MRIHHLDCAPVRPYFPRVSSATLCTLVVSSAGLMLIDTGLGRRDIAGPSLKMKLFMTLLRFGRDPAQTAYRQIEGLGYRPKDVKHILVTHLHFDHSGGLPDFPDAVVHVTRAEVETALNPTGVRRLFYEQAHWQHGPRWRIHDDVDSEAWFGFDAIEVGEIASPRTLLVPLPGHSPGHAGVAVETARGWLFHCGDALAFGGLDSPAPDRISRLACGPHIARVRRLAREHPDEVEVVSSHLPTSRLSSSSA